jgi:arabinose-5-phosphate isomerase
MNHQQILNIAKQVFKTEIEGISEVESRLNENFCKAVELISQCKGKLIATGMGKSGHIAKKVVATFSSTGTPSSFMHPAEALHGDIGIVDNNDIVLAISYSGETDELQSIFTIINNQQVPIIAMTSNDQSSLARASTMHLNIKVSKEAGKLSIVPTTSTTSSLVLCDALAVCVYCIREFTEQNFAKLHPSGTLGRKLITKVKDVMHSKQRLPKVFSYTPSKEVIIEISNKGVGFVAVVDDKHNLVGVITDGDLRRFLDHNSDLSKFTAADIMHHNPMTINENELAVRGFDLMKQYKINGLLVINDNNELTGAFNIHTLIAAKLI